MTIVHDAGSVSRTPTRSGATPSSTRTATAIAPNNTPAISPAATAARTPSTRIKAMPAPRITTDAASTHRNPGPPPLPNAHHDRHDDTPAYEPAQSTPPAV